MQVTEKSNKMQSNLAYFISSNKTRGYYLFIGPSTAGISRGLVSFSKYVNLKIKTCIFYKSFLDLSKIK